MGSITENLNRIGNFTSGEIYKLIPTGKGEGGFNVAGITYIKSKNIERKLGISAKQNVYTRPIAWGNFIEVWVHEKKLSTAYKSVGKVTLNHPTIEFWKGSPDFDCESESLVCECKGYERTNLSLYADAILSGSTKVLKEECPDEYWQLVSNAILLGYDKIQPLVYAPYKSELPEIADFIDNYLWDNPFDYKFIYDAIVNGNENDLPYLPDNCYYKNLTTAVLEIPKEDKIILTDAVSRAGKLLIPFFKAQ